MLCAGVLVPTAIFYKESYLYLYLAAITVFTYTANLTAVTYERLISITKPLRYRSIITRQTSLRITIAAWVIPVSYCLIPLTWNTNIQGLEHKVYIIVALLVFLVFPLFFICFVYIRILVEVHRLLKESRHLVVYTVNDDADAPADSLFKRLRKTCSSLFHRIRQKTIRREAGSETGHRPNEDSSEETGFTCKTELYATSLLHDSPRLICPQSRRDKRGSETGQQRPDVNVCCKNQGAAGQYLQVDGQAIPLTMKDRKKSQDGLTESCGKEGEEVSNDGLSARPGHIKHQICVVSQTNNRNLEVRAIAHEASDDNQMASNEVDVKEDVPTGNVADECQQSGDSTACQDIVHDNEETQSVDVHKNANDVGKVDEITEESCNLQIAANKDCTDSNRKEEPKALESKRCYDCRKKKQRNGRETCQKIPRRRRQKSFRRRQMLQEIKATTAFAAVAFTYMFTWIPVIYMTFMGAIGRPNLVPQSIDDVNIWTVALNAAIDPFFYALILQNFRKVIKKKLRRMKNRNK